MVRVRMTTRCSDASTSPTPRNMNNAQDDDGCLMQGSPNKLHDAGRQSRVPASSSTGATIMAPHKPTQPHNKSTTAAAPPRRTFFDPWNSSSTGHQRAENRLSGSTSWRASRNLKLGEQYRGGLSGGKRVADTVGAGSTELVKDGRRENDQSGGQKSLAEVWAASRAGKKTCQDKEPSTYTNQDHECDQAPDSDVHSGLLESSAQLPEKHIFSGLCFYINGSTAPLVSDHRLKHFLVLHGARHSIALGRRTVTHVILGTSSTNGGAGGGLAATKLQKEIARTGGKAVKFITAEW